MKRKLFTIAAAVVCLLMTACGNKQANEQQTDKVDGRTEITFWFHAADADANRTYKQLMKDFNHSQSKYYAKYVGFSTKDYPDKLSNAIATNKLPDVASLGATNVATYVAQGVVKPIDSVAKSWSEYKDIDQGQLAYLRQIGNGKLYGLPYAYNENLSYMNMKMADKYGIKPPVTQSDFLKLAKRYADVNNNRYFYSMRAQRPYDNLIPWLFTYAHAKSGSYFNADGTSVFRNPRFVTGMKKFVSLYTSHEVTGDSINNDFNKMVAEFASETSMYIMHNSSSYVSVAEPIGAKNIAILPPLANSRGQIFTSAPQPNMYSIMKKPKGEAHYQGAIALAKFLASKKNASKVCQSLGRCPANLKIYDEAWAKKDPVMTKVGELRKTKQLTNVYHPFWLPEMSKWMNTTSTDDFQAVMMKDKTAKQVLDEWADSFETWEKEFNSDNKE